MKKTFGDNFYYILYFQEPGVAEAEFDKDPRGIPQPAATSRPTRRASRRTITDPKRSAGGWMRPDGRAQGAAALAHPGGSRLLRQRVHANRASAAASTSIATSIGTGRRRRSSPTAKITAPATFIAGDRDGVIRGATAEQLTASMSRSRPTSAASRCFPSAGHWVQQERPEETNAALLAFLAGLSKPKT